MFISAAARLHTRGGELIRIRRADAWRGDGVAKRRAFSRPYRYMYTASSRIEDDDAKITLNSAHCVDCRSELTLFVNRA